jgi:hypothetical protein
MDKPNNILVHRNNGISCIAICMNLWCTLPITVAARSKAWVGGLSLAVIVGSNPAGGADICLL